MSSGSTSGVGGQRRAPASLPGGHSHEPPTRTLS
jgi:hypothetical protein